jgi:hypothetical protein
LNPLRGLLTSVQVKAFDRLQLLVCAHSGHWRELVICCSANDTPFHLQAILPASVCPGNYSQFTDQESIDRIHYDLAHPRLIKVTKRDYKAESAKGIKLLRVYGFNG